MGRPVAEALAARGHEVRVLSRRAPAHPVDLRTGAGLAAALDGVAVVVDASNGPPGRRAAATLVAGSRHLLSAAAAAGVRHHVCLSIVGVDEVSIAYYRLKLEQEAVVRAGAVPWSIVRATQAHPLVDAIVGAFARRRLAPRSGVLLAPVDPGDAGEAIADVAEGTPRLGIVEVGGPEVLTLSELAAQRLAGRRAIELPLPLPPRLGPVLRRGGLVPADPEVRGTKTYERWRATCR